MQNNFITVLFIGDIFGRPGREAVKNLLKKNDDEFDLIIANCENTSNGKGITPQHAIDLFSYGVNVLTSGNHIWSKKDIIPFLNESNPIIRPLNFPSGTPGKGSILIKLREEIPIGIINLQGRIFMKPIDCPFRIALKEIKRIKQYTNIIIVDFHAEATSEKVALGYLLDGKVSAIIGSHTHVQTNDAKILPLGSGYITDVGMTGPEESIIGVDINTIIKSYLYGLPEKFNVAKSYNSQINYVKIKIDLNTGCTLSIKSEKELIRNVE